MGLDWIAVVVAIVLLGVSWSATRTGRKTSFERHEQPDVEAAGRRDMSNVERLR